MEMNGYLAKEINRINKALSDIWCKSIWGVTTDELVKNIIEEERNSSIDLIMKVKEMI